MAISYSKQTDIPRGQLFISEDEVGSGIYVEYQPSIERVKQAGKNPDDITLYRKELLWLGDDIITNGASFYKLNSAIEIGTKPFSSGCQSCQRINMLNTVVVKAKRA